MVFVRPGWFGKVSAFSTHPDGYEVRLIEWWELKNPRKNMYTGEYHKAPGAFNTSYDWIATSTIAVPLSILTIHTKTTQIQNIFNSNQTKPKNIATQPSQTMLNQTNNIKTITNNPNPTKPNKTIQINVNSNRKLQMDRQIDRPTDRPIDRQTNRQTERPTDSQPDRQKDGKTNIPIDPHTDRLTERQTGRQVERQTCR
jgi:hypothetical protein